jgi:hypothetical protein
MKTLKNAFLISNFIENMGPKLSSNTRYILSLIDMLKNLRTPLLSPRDHYS